MNAASLARRRDVLPRWLTVAVVAVNLAGAAAIVLPTPDAHHVALGATLLAMLLAALA